MATQKIISDPSVTPSPEYVFQMALAREVGLSRLLVAYIGSGIAFMLLPGTFLGVWNLISISNKQATASVAPAWLQAHGQAQACAAPLRERGIRPLSLPALSITGVVITAG